MTTNTQIALKLVSILISWSALFLPAGAETVESPKDDSSGPQQESLVTEGAGKATTQKFQHLLNNGCSLDTQSEYSRAITVFSKAIDESPENAKGYYFRGLAYFHDANYRPAITDLSKALELNPNYQDAYLIRGFAFSENHDYEESISDFNCVMAKDPQFKEALKAEADVYEKLGKNDLAKSARDAAAKMHYRSRLAEGTPAIADFSKYMPELQRLVKASWRPPKSGPSKATVLTFTVHRNRTISDIKVKQSSGDSAFDELAVTTVQKLTLIPPFPPGSPEKNWIDFTFDYNPIIDVYRTNKFVGLPIGLPITMPPGLSDYQAARRLLAEQKDEEAIPLFLKALSAYNSKTQDSRSKDRIAEIQSALGICYLQLSNKCREAPIKQIEYLHHSLYYRPDLEDAQKDLNDAINQIGKNPANATDRVQLGDDALLAGDDIGATVEYLQALKIKDEPAIRRKLDSIKHSHEQNPK